jgi:hypothetical protein
MYVCNLVGRPCLAVAFPCEGLEDEIYAESKSNKERCTRVSIHFE